MRKILKNVPVAGPRFSLRAASAPENVTAHASRAATLRVEPPVPPAPPVADEKQMLQWRQAAERQGYEAGFKAGAAEAAKQLEHELARMAAMRDSLSQAQAEQRQQWQEFGVEFAFAVAMRVLGSAAPGRDGIEGMVAAALAQAGNAAVLAVRVHPNDVAWVRQLLAGRPECAEGEPVKVVADAQVGQGGCLLDTSRGTLDARLETQVHALKESVLAAYAMSPKGPAG